MMISEPWEFGTLGIYDYMKPGYYHSVFRYLSETKNRLHGDILEAGTFRGRMSMAFALWLRQEKLDSEVHTFDTFEGFPGYSKEDQFENFWKLRNSGFISDLHFARIEKLYSMNNALGNTHPDPSNLSTSKDFSDNELPLLLSKINLLKLSNLKIHVGPFSKTMRSDEIQQRKWWLVFIDCDLYQGYLETLSATWNNVVGGGMVFLDEYYSLKFPGAFIAVEEFRKQVSDARLIEIDSNPSFPRWALIKTDPGN